MIARTTIATKMKGVASRTIDISGFLVMFATTKQQQSKWGREQANHDVDDHHDPEMHEINAECLRRWNQNRNDDKENRGSLK